MRSHASDSSPAESGARSGHTVFCTIVTSDYLPFALTLHESLSEWRENVRTVALVAVPQHDLAEIAVPDVRGFSMLSADDLCTHPVDRELHGKYFGAAMDAYRWSAKPGLMKKLLDDPGCESVAYCDCDVLFTGDVQGLLDGLTGASMVVTPHWYDIDPGGRGGDFPRWFHWGICNAGFVAANHRALPILDWWQRACLYACPPGLDNGLYADQKYLDLLPFLFDGVHVNRDDRCNVGGWRLDRFLAGRQDCWPLPAEEAPVFLHFTGLRDIRLPGPGERVLADYSKRLQRNGLPYNLLANIKAQALALSQAETALAKAAPQQARFGGRVRRALAIGTRLRHLREVLRPRPRWFE